MLTSKQRSHLKSIAANLQPVGQLGKGGMSENMLRSFSDALEARELIKINVLTNAEEDARSLGDDALSPISLTGEYRSVTYARRSSSKIFFDNTTYKLICQAVFTCFFGIFYVIFS